MAVTWWPPDPTVVALIGTLMGGVGLKVVEHWLAKGKAKMQDMANLKADVRATVNDTEARMDRAMERLDKVEAEVDDWRGKYYSAQEQILVLKAMMIGAGIDPDKTPTKDL